MSTSDIEIGLAEFKDPVAAQYMSDLANTDPILPKPEAVIERERAYVFRTRAGTTENPMIRIPGITFEQESDEKHGERWAKVYRRKHGDMAEFFEDVRDRVGDRWIMFNRIGPGKGAFFQTDDPVVAEFMRGIVKAGTVIGLYEDYAQSAPIRSRYTDQTFPNTEQGRNDLARYDLAIEQAAETKRKAEAKPSKSATVKAPAARASGKATVKS